MTILLAIIVVGVIYSAYNLGCIWAYRCHDRKLGAGVPPEDPQREKEKAHEH